MFLNDLLNNTLFVTFIPFVYLVLLIIYKYIRRKFPIKVNCWFCNKNTSVSYNHRNSFICPNCKQYNGFTQDGDYNKSIPEQRDELLNHIITPRKLHYTANTNGLCIICNNNQQLKVYQLANFIPLNEDNYDVEIEHFQKQLEKAYKLCQRCNSTVKKTISWQNCKLLGRQIEEIRKSGKTLLNQSTASIINNRVAFRVFLMGTCLVFLFIARVVWFNQSQVDILQWHVWIQFFEEIMSLIGDYKRELGFAVVSSLVTSIIMHLRRNQESSNPKMVTKIKTENMDYSNSNFNDLSFASFSSPLNSTVRSAASEDSFSVNSITASNTKVFNYTNDVNASKTFCKSPSPSVYSFAQSNNSFSNLNLKKSSLDSTFSTFEQLNLTNANKNSFTACSRDKRQILSPAKFRNPWTGKSWDVCSQSSSQSSGVYSRGNSVCGDEVASITSEPFKSAQLNGEFTLPTGNFSGFSRSSNNNSLSMLDRISLFSPDAKTEKSMNMHYD